MITDITIRDQVATTLPAELVTDFDLTGITREIMSRFGRVDIDTIDPDTYWAIVARYDTTLVTGE